MKAEIYYFTGTGNSLFMARELAVRLDARLTPISSAMGGGELHPDAETIGIVFPVYYGELPVIVKRFASRLTGIGGKYIFAVCSYGGAAGGSLKTLGRILLARGGKLSAGYGIHMPQNAFYKFWEKHDRIYAVCNRRLEKVIRNTTAGKSGVYLSNLLFELLFLPMHALLKPLYKKNFIKQSGAPPDTDIDSMIALLDKSFHADDTCNGCGVCARVCPVSNISITEGRPVWLNHCENCLACYNWCPKKAIHGGVAEKGYYYRHPGVGLAEMFHEHPFKCDF